MANPLSPMAQPAGQANDASMSIVNAVHLMKPVKQSPCPEALRRVRGRAGHGGFSLMELMIAVTIIGILMAIGIPVYREYLIRANQSAAKAVLMEVSSRQEQYLMKAGAFSGVYTAATCFFDELAYAAPAEVCANFNITLTAGTIPITYSVDAMRGLPTFTVSASGKAGTIQANFPPPGAATAYSINQFGLRLPVSAW